MNNNSSTKSKSWKEYCNKHKKNHIIALQPCPSCGVYYTPQPISQKVYESHQNREYICDGCEAYEDHLN